MNIIDMIEYLLSMGWRCEELEGMDEYEIEDAYEAEMKVRIAG